ncbi:MAG: exodeoxyribonuclease VII large subunit [Bacteroidales bacterium]|nr:exodeoxyribonuclease VII large subunit [Bacteroidales bacterium]
MKEHVNNFSLSELQEIIRESLLTKLPEEYWVRAEISELKINYSGHYYLELTESNALDDNVIARIRAIIWNRQARLLIPYFKTTAGHDLAEGLGIMVKVKVEYHHLYGLSLIIIDIDPKFTVGDLALKKTEIIKRLRSDGVIDMNRQLLLPLLPKNIAVISSEKAAGYQDFSDHLINNSYGYAYKADLFQAAMQGYETSLSIINAFDKINTSPVNYDVVVIVRGGGSQTDLNWFDNYELGYFITQFPIPVITGIGHDKDLSVTDIVANRNCKTPTAAADLIIETTALAENHLLSVKDSLIENTERILKSNRSGLETLSLKLMPAARNEIVKKSNLLKTKSVVLENSVKLLLRSKEQEISSKAGHLVNNLKHFISIKRGLLSEKLIKLQTEPGRDLYNKKLKIERIGKLIHHLSPENVLKRGYSITLKNNKAVKGVKGINKGDRVTTLLYNGKLCSEIFEINK